MDSYSHSIILNSLCSLQPHQSPFFPLLLTPTLQCTLAVASHPMHKAMGPWMATQKGSVFFPCPGIPKVWDRKTAGIVKSSQAQRRDEVVLESIPVLVVFVLFLFSVLLIHDFFSYSVVSCVLFWIQRLWCICSFPSVSVHGIGAETQTHSGRG